MKKSNIDANIWDEKQELLGLILEQDYSLFVFFSVCLYFQHLTNVHYNAFVIMRGDKNKRKDNITDTLFQSNTSAGCICLQALVCDLDLLS